MMNTFATYALEVIGAAWIVIVAVQYIGSYYVPELRVDFVWAYKCMLALTVIVAVLRAVMGRGTDGKPERSRAPRVPEETA